MADVDQSRAGTQTPPDGNVWSVHRLNAQIGSVLNAAGDQFPSFVVGEVSDIHPYEYGTFFDLRDLNEDTTISCILWAYQRDTIDHELEAGTETVIQASVDFYEDNGQTQLAVKQFWPVGDSDRSEGLEELRAQLDAEGLIDAAAKQSLPTYPSHIGVVTSLSGSAREDVREAVRSRNPGLPITICDATVQGDAAVPSLVNGIQRLDQSPDVDVLVVTRGGGADADLWCFNEEPVVRAIAGCTTPTVVAIGHEDDDTLAEAVADHRSMTPTDAGAAVAPNLSVVRREATQLERRIDRTHDTLVADRIDRFRQRLNAGYQQIEQRVQRRQAAQQRATDLEQRIRVAYASVVSDRVDTLEQRIAAAHRDVIHTTEQQAVTTQAAQRRLYDLETRIDRAYKTHVDRELNQLEIRIETGYRDRVADARVTTTQTRTRQLWAAVAILVLLLVLTLLAVVTGVI